MSAFSDSQTLENRLQLGGFLTPAIYVSEDGEHWWIDPEVLAVFQHSPVVCGRLEVHRLGALDDAADHFVPVIASSA